MTFAAITEQRLRDDVGAQMAANQKEVGVVSAMFNTNKKNAQGEMLLTTAMGTALVALRERGESLTGREMLFLIMNEPGSGPKAYLFGRLLQLCLVLSALSTTYESVSWVNEVTGAEIWLMLKVVFNIIFTVEAVLRIVSFIPFSGTLRSSYVWLDIITCLPLYLRMFLAPTSMTAENYLSKTGAGITIRAIEALSGFRILKLCRYYEGASLLAMAVGKSLKQLYVPLFMLLLMVYCFASVVFEIEFDPVVQRCVELWRAENVSLSFLKSQPGGVAWGCDVCSQKHDCKIDDADCIFEMEMKCATCNGYPAGHPECSSIVWAQTFQDIPRSMWFMFVTVSTVGYGDISPVTWQGQLFVCFVIISGIIFLAMPLAIVGSTFGQVWNDRQVIKLQRHMRQILARSGIEPSDAVSAFKKIDVTGDGMIGKGEFRSFVDMNLGEMDPEEIKQLWSALDRDNSGSMTMEEFMERAFPDFDLGDEDFGRTEENATAAPTKGVDDQIVSSIQLKQAEIIGTLGEQSASLSQFDIRLAAIESMLAELVAAKRDERADSFTPDSDTPPSRLQSSKKPNRSQSSRSGSGSGRSGSKSKPDSRMGRSSVRPAYRREGGRQTNGSGGGRDRGGGGPTPGNERKLLTPPLSSDSDDMDA